MEKKDSENVHQNLVLDLFKISVNNPKQPLYARNSIKNRYFKRRSKILKKLTFIFSFKPSLFKKQKRIKTSDQLLFSLKILKKSYYQLCII